CCRRALCRAISSLRRAFRCPIARRPSIAGCTLCYPGILRGGMLPAGERMVTYRAVMMGFGNVGRAVATLFLQRSAAIARDHDVAVRFVLVADRSGAAVDPAGLDLQRLLDVKAGSGGVAAYPTGGQPGLGGAAAIASVAADLLLEASPTAVRTGEPGLAHIRAALGHGLHVVNANKGPLVVAYHDLMRLARERGVELRNAGTVAAPTPALELARSALHG